MMNVPWEVWLVAIALVFLIGLCLISLLAAQIIKE